MLERTCISCRQTEKKEHLLRIVLSAEGSLVWDRQQKLPGRGAYVHGRYGCWAKMPELRRWQRAFRLKKGDRRCAGILGRISELMEEIRIEVAEVRKRAGSPKRAKRQGPIRL